MELLNAEQAKGLTPEQLAKRQEQKQAEHAEFMTQLKAQAELAIESLPRDEDGVPYLKVRADDPDAWKVVMFYSQRLRDRGDIKGRMKFGAAAHGFEFGYWRV